MSDQQAEVKAEVVLPSALVIRVQKLVEKSSPSLTVSEYVERAVRSAVATDENQEGYQNDEDSDSIVSRLRALGYL